VPKLGLTVWDEGVGRGVARRGAGGAAVAAQANAPFSGVTTRELLYLSLRGLRLASKMPQGIDIYTYRYR